MPYVCLFVRWLLAGMGEKKSVEQLLICVGLSQSLDIINNTPHPYDRAWRLHAMIPYKVMRIVYPCPFEICEIYTQG